MIVLIVFYRSRPSGIIQEVSQGSGCGYTVYHPHYKALGVLPQVRLAVAGRDQLVLNRHNTHMLQSTLTVKVAPPDVIRPPAQL